MLKDLCLLNGTSGDESAVRDYIISKIKDNCEYKVDALGSIIAFKKGKKGNDLRSYGRSRFYYYRYYR